MESQFDIRLKNNTGKVWKKFELGYVKGYAFVGENYLLEEDIYKGVIIAIDDNNLDEYLYSLNGNFSIVIWRNGLYYLITDKLGSYPLFYSIKAKIVADIANLLIDWNSYEIDKLNESEFLATGYVTGNTTLIKDIYRVVAGSYMVFNPEKGIVNTTLYFSHIYPKKNVFQKVLLFDDAEFFLEKAFCRMLCTLDGKQTLLLPLSGGYDSRLLACLCKKFNLTNVVCYTYGRGDSFEVTISEQVAKNLGYEWYFVEYSEETWTEFLQSDYFIKYCNFSGNLSANPHFQDLPALLALKKKGVLKSNMIVIPGFCGDLLGGSKIPVEILENNISSFTEKELIDTIYVHNYNLNVLRKREKQFLYNKLLKEFEGTYTNGNIDDFLDLYEPFWFTKNRLSKFIINAVRAFEFVGLDWRMPLWDDEYVRVWYELHWKEKFYSSLLNDFMFERYFIPYNVGFYKKQTILNSNLGLCLKTMLPSQVVDFYRATRESFCRKMNRKNFNAFDHVINYLYDKSRIDEFEQLKSVNRNNINAIVSAYYLRMLQKRI